MFREEIRAVAALEHPAIVQVYDTGVVTEAAADAAEGALRAGSPWLAMEYASRGALADLPPPNDWSEVRDRTMAILDALAHAHARGVVHRDLKPANVLWCGPEARRPGLKLSDFGLAFSMDREEDRVGVAGTPEYMAPEQFRGAWREVGPWTDLYALGCGVWEQVTGTPPFGHQPVAALASAHASAPLPALEPLFDVPPGLDRWLAGLLAKRPHDRVAMAADAARQLALLAEVSGASPIRTPFRDLGTLAACLDDDLSSAMSDLEEDDLVTEETALPIPAPQFPVHWQTHPPAAPHLPGSGLGLHGLREPQVEGRQSERDALWAQLGVAFRSRRTQVALLRGSRGVGKSRLGEWLVRRAHELALAEVVQLRHHPGQAETAGVDGALSSVLRLGGLEGPERRAWAVRVLSERGASDAAIQLVGAVAGRSERVGELDAWGALRAVLALRIRARAMILWVRDAALASRSLAFVETLLALPWPLLVVVDLDDDESPADPGGVDRLGSHPGALVVDLQPMSPAAIVRLTMAQGLDEPLSVAVAARASGVPMFAIQLVRDWVQRGALIPGPAGYVLAPGEVATIPDDLHALWTSRVRALGPGAEPALRMAAVLGREFEPEAWEHVAGGAATPELVELLLAQRLIQRTEDGNLLFTHELLRESLLRGLPAEELPSRHRACAAARTRLPVTMSRSVAIAQHLEEARDLPEAWTVHLQASMLAELQGDTSQAVASLARAEELLVMLAPDDTDGRWASVRNKRAMLELTRGRPTDAYARAVEAEFAARRAGDPELLAQSLNVQTVALTALGRAEAGAILAEELLSLARNHELGPAAANALYLLGDCARNQGRLAQALELYQQAADHPDAAQRTRAKVLLGRAACYLQRGELDAAERCYTDLLPSFTTVADVANTHNELGNLARKRGHFAEATAHYHAAIERLQLFGADRSAIPSMNLALVYLAQGHFPEARTLIGPVQTALLVSGRRAFAAACSAILAASAAAAADAAEFVARCAEVTRVRAKGFVDADMGWALEQAGDQWVAHARDDLARTAYSEALEHLREDAEHSARLRRRLEPA